MFFCACSSLGEWMDGAHAECEFMQNGKHKHTCDQFTPIKIHVLYCSLHLQSCPTPTSQRPLIFAHLIWPCGRIQTSDMKQTSSVMKRREWLTLIERERRFMSRTVGCRLRVRVSEMRLNPRYEYGKSTLCRWHQATPSTKNMGGLGCIDHPQQSAKINEIK